MIKRIALAVLFVMNISPLAAQTVYDSKTLVDTNNNSTSTSTVNSNNNNISTSTSTNLSTVNSNSTNTNLNTSVNTNNNINSGTQTLNNNNVNSGTMTYNNNNVNTGNMTNNNINTSNSNSVNTNNNINSGTMTYNNNNVSTSTSTNTNNNVNTGDMTNRNINSSTSTSNNNNTSTNNNVNQNVQSGSMTNQNNNNSTSTMKIEQPPPTAIAPAMMSGGNIDLCTTGVSGAVQTQILGLASGGTIRDMNCERLKLSKTLYDMGMKVAAVSTMCQDERVFSAMMNAGTPCPIDGKIGEAAKDIWAANPHKQPKKEVEKNYDELKGFGIGSILVAILFLLF